LQDIVALVADISDPAARVAIGAAPHLATLYSQQRRSTVLLAGLDNAERPIGVVDIAPVKRETGDSDGERVAATAAVEQTR
jgi:hypothetical protein